MGDLTLGVLDCLLQVCSSLMLKGVLSHVGSKEADLEASLPACGLPSSQEMRMELEKLVDLSEPGEVPGKKSLQGFTACHYK